MRKPEEEPNQAMSQLWNENISCHINKHGMSQPSAISGLQMWNDSSQNFDPEDAATP